jgi:hypothetical protein
VDLIPAQMKELRTAMSWDALAACWVDYNTGDALCDKDGVAVQQRRVEEPGEAHEGEVRFRRYRFSPTGELGCGGIRGAVGLGSGPPLLLF